MNKVLLVITTESDKKKAKYIAKLLIKKSLAACVTLKDINSIYKWKEKIEDSKEVEICIKSKPKLRNNIISFLQQKTSYDIPQIIYKKFKSEKNYINWLKKSLLN